MCSFTKGMGAGLVATVVLSLLMLATSLVGLVPGLDLPRMVSELMGRPGSSAPGWTVIFIVGIFGYGPLVALLSGQQTAASDTAIGVVLALIGWLATMVVLMPLAGAGMFAYGLGLAAPLLTLVLHLVFGVVLGWFYGRSALHYHHHHHAHRRGLSVTPLA